MVIKRYFELLSDVLKKLPVENIEKLKQILSEARASRKNIFVFGNGGSAATASHFACDLGKGTVTEGRHRYRVLTLHDIGVFSAYANDLGYETVFSEQLKSLAQPGDIAVAISVSGNSPNVVRAIETARALGLYTVGLTGLPGGKLSKLAHLSIVIPSNDTQIVEDLHLAVLHAVFRALIEDEK